MNLTQHQIRIGKLVQAGLSQAQIAAKLNIKISTVKFHLTTIYRVYNVKSRYEYINKVSKAITQTGFAIVSSDHSVPLLACDTKTLREAVFMLAMEMAGLKLGSALTVGQQKKLAECLGLPRINIWRMNNEFNVPTAYKEAPPAPMPPPPPPKVDIGPLAVGARRAAS